jgi:ParB-like chromosome segregation protein Spo0J
MTDAQTTKLGPVKALPLSKVVVDPAISIREMLVDPDTITRYGDSLSHLPPIVVAEHEGDYIVADGVHRTNAHTAQDKTTIKGRVLQGGWDAAYEFAAVCNLEHGRPLTTAEIHGAAKRLLGLGRSQAQVAKSLHRTRGWTTYVAQIVEVQEEVGTDVDLPETALAAIQKADKAHWQPLAETAVRRDWRIRDIQDAITTLDDPAMVEVLHEAASGNDEAVLTPTAPPSPPPDAPAVTEAVASTPTPKREPEPRPLPASDILAPTSPDTADTDAEQIISLSNNLDYAIDGLMTFGQTRVSEAFRGAEVETDVDYRHQLEEYHQFLGDVIGRMAALAEDA